MGNVSDSRRAVLATRESMKTASVILATLSLLCSYGHAEVLARPDHVHGQAVIKDWDPYSVVSVCPFRDAWWIAWHTPPGVDAAKASRVRSQLNETDFNECLAALVVSDAETRAAVERGIRGIDVSKSPPTIDIEAAQASNTAVYKRWTAFGVNAAINEVAETGERGERVAEVLAACDKLQPPTGEEP